MHISHSTYQRSYPNEKERKPETGKWIAADADVVCNQMTE